MQMARSKILSQKDHNSMEAIEIINYFKSLQNQICDGIAKADGQGTFKEDAWTRSEGGGVSLESFNKEKF